MVIPHSGDRVSKLQIPIILLKRAKYAGIVLMMMSAFFVYSYISMKGDTIKLNQLEQENQIQKEKIIDYSDKMAEIKSQLKELDDLDNQVREMLDIKDKTEQSSKDVAAAVSDGNLASRSAKSIGRIGGSVAFAGQEDIDVEEMGQQLLEIAQEIESKKDNFAELKEKILAREERLAKVPSIAPVSGRITSAFGYRVHPIYHKRIFHDGIDMVSYYGAPIHAAAAGKVVFSGYKNGYGKTVIINHENGFETLYAHNSKLIAKVGDRVQKGESVAKLGNTGRSTGPHVHYEVHKNGKLVNPTKYF